MRFSCTAAAVALLAVALMPECGHAQQPRITPDVVYGHKDGMALTFDVFKPSGRSNRAGVLFMVSGGWYSRWAPPERAAANFRPLTDAGFTVFAVRHGSSPRYVIPEVVEDVRRAVRFVRLSADKFGVDADRLGVYGGSAGGHLSLVLGTSSDAGDSSAKDAVLRTSDRVAAVVAYFPPADLRDFRQLAERFPALRFDRELEDDCSPIDHVTADDPPTLLIHGDQDQLVPIEQSHRIHAAFQQRGVTSKVIVITGAAHGFRGKDAERAKAAMVAWFQEHLLVKDGG